MSTSSTEVRAGDVPRSREAEAEVTVGGGSTAPPVAPVADPAPLGLAAFALTTFVLSLFNAGLAPEALESTVLPLALFYGGIAQFVAGLWEFRAANTFGATAFCSFGSFWIAYAAYVQFVEPGLPAESATFATGLFLVGWTLFTGYMLIASLRLTNALVMVFSLLLTTFALLTIGDLTGVDAIATAGGFVGIATALAAWYASAALVTNATWGRTVLPVGPRG